MGVLQAAKLGRDWVGSQTGLALEGVSAGQENTLWLCLEVYLRKIRATVARFTYSLRDKGDVRLELPPFW